MATKVIGRNNIEIVVGEIKSGKDKKYAIIQVIESLLILRKAAMLYISLPYEELVVFQSLE